MFIDNLDLLKIYTLLKASWKMFIICVFIGIVVSLLVFSLWPKSHIVSSNVVVNPSMNPYIVGNSLSYASSDQISQLVFDELGDLSNRIKNIYFLQNTKDNNLITIQIEASDFDNAVIAVNTYSNTVVEQYRNGLSIVNEDLKSAEVELENAEAILLAYLEDNELQDLSWAELAQITGIDMPNTVIYPTAPASLSMEQRATISTMMRNIVQAKANFSNVYSNFLLIDQNHWLNNAIVVNYAPTITDIENQQRKSNDYIFAIMAGVFLGFVVGFFIIIFKDWREIFQNKVVSA